MARTALFQVAEIEGKESLALLQQVLATVQGRGDAAGRPLMALRRARRRRGQGRPDQDRAAPTADDEMAEMAVFALAEIKEDVGTDVLARHHEERQVRAGAPGRAHGPLRRGGRGVGPGPARGPADRDRPRAQGTRRIRPRPDQERRGRGGPARDRQGQGRPAGPGRRDGARRDRHAQGQGRPARDPREEGRLTGRGERERNDETRRRRASAPGPGRRSWPRRPSAAGTPVRPAARRGRRAGCGGRAARRLRSTWALGQAPKSAARARPSGSATASTGSRESGPISAGSMPDGPGRGPDRRRHPGREDGAARPRRATATIVRKAAKAALDEIDAKGQTREEGPQGARLFPQIRAGAIGPSWPRCG
ncbi:MAG: hypothetical protein MZW92_68510 [Comamonadaceae bacterium]|nr:hypothetical protein [Comamonadaceae bacterium]